MCGARVHHQAGGASVGKGRQHGVLDEEEGRHVVLLKHNLAELLPLVLHKNSIITPYKARKQNIFSCGENTLEVKIPGLIFIFLMQVGGKKCKQDRRLRLSVDLGPEQDPNFNQVSMAILGSIKKNISKNLVFRLSIYFIYASKILLVSFIFHVKQTQQNLDPAPDPRKK